MIANEIVEALKNKKGQHVQAVWQRPVKTLKTFTGIVAKRTSAFVRTGINYANLSSVKAGIASGERGEVESLPWGKWRDGHENYIIDHNGTEYVRLYPAVFGNLVEATKTEFTLNGVPVEYTTIEPYLLASEKRKDDDAPKCFTLKAENIVTIAGE